jgi:hypothetical protein
MDFEHISKISTLDKLKKRRLIKYYVQCDVINGQTSTRKKPNQRYLQRYQYIQTWNENKAITFKYKMDKTETKQLDRELI